MPVRSKNLFSAMRVAAVPQHFLRAAIGVVGVSLFAMGAQAGEATPQLTINYTDLDLSKSVDAQALYAQLQSASRYVCNGFEGRELQRIQQHRACYAQALSDAVAVVDHANVTALYRSNNSIRVAQRGSNSQPRS